MFERLKEKLSHASKETIKETIREHSPEFVQGATVILLLYLCIKVNGKPVTVTVNVNGGSSFV